MTVSVLLVILYRAFFWFARGVEKNIRILTKKLFPLTHYSIKALLFLWQRTAPPKIKNAPPPNRNCTPVTGFYQNYGSLPKSPVNKRVFWTFFCSFAQNRLKTMERTGRFLERTRRFRAFWHIRTVKISSFRHHLKFRSTCCRNSPIREVPFR